MRRGRFPSRWRIFLAALPSFFQSRHRCEVPTRILIAHNLLLGDTLMLTGLLARLRRRYPNAEIVMTVSPAAAPLFSTRPYGVIPAVWKPDQVGTYFSLKQLGDFDIAFVPGENRHALLARALGARWVVALEGDRPGWKNFICDELISLPRTSATLTEIFSSLAGSGSEVFSPADWPQESQPFSMPSGEWVVLHLGASSKLRHWPPAHWAELADRIAMAGFEPVWCAGPGEESLINAADPCSRFQSYAGKLDLPQTRALLAGSRLVVCLDSGIAHLARLGHTPTIVLYGPGTPVLFGAGRFWQGSESDAVWDQNFSCRDQQSLFKRKINWVQRCQRSEATCSTRPRCMEEISVEQVWAKIAPRLLNNHAN